MGDPFEKWHKELWESDRDPKTKAKYWQVLTAYQSWLNGRGPDVPTAKEFISYLREKGYAQGTLLVYKHGLSPFFESMGQTLKIKLKKHHSLPEYHDRGDVERLISEAEKGLYRHTRELKERNTAIIVTLAYSGIRRGELVSLRVNDLEFHRRTIRVRQGKGNRDRVVPMHERLVPHLRGQCAGKGAREKVFSINGRKVHKMVTQLARRCGLDAFSPHSLRHYCATQLVEKGANLRAVQMILGHQSLETTSVYIDVAPRHLQETIDLLDEPNVRAPDRRRFE